MVAAEQTAESRRGDRWWAIVEVLLIFLLLAALGSAPPPDVNEAHYLAKAKHYWDPSWCHGDLFLDSADAHLVFYWTVGWLTFFLPLPAVAWVGRIATWLLLAWSWQRLSAVLVPGRLYAVLTAGLFATLIDRAHMAGEWVVGGVEAKGFAYVLVLLGLRCVALGQWPRVWLLLGAASAFHVLVGGWAVVAAVLAWCVTGDRSSRWVQVPYLAAGLVLALPGLLPSAALTWGAEPEIARQAAVIYVYERLSHHLVFHRFPTGFVVRHVALWVIWLGLFWQMRGDARLRRLGWLVAAAALIAGIGVVMDTLLKHHPGTVAGVLRFYWFRLSDVMLPTGMALWSLAWLSGLRNAGRRWAVLPMAAAALLVAWHVGGVARQHLLDPRPGAVSQASPVSLLDRHRLYLRYHFWRDVCGWIADNTPADAVFLTPRYQQTFKWFAGRSEAANWKDVPQDAAMLVEWWERMQQLYPRTQAGMSRALSDSELQLLARQYGFQYILLDRSRHRRRVRLPKIYPPHTEQVSLYEVYYVGPPDRLSGGAHTETQE